MKARRDGVAIVVVLLVTTAILMSVMSSAAVSALGARRNASSERVAYQALLASESGVNTIAQRLSASNYRVALNEDPSLSQAERDVINMRNVNAFLGANGLGTLSLADGTAAISVVAFDSSGANPRVTIRSVSTLANGNTKTVLQDVWLEKPPAINVSVPGALTSRNAVTVTGGGILTGIVGRTHSGLIQTTTTSGAVTVLANASAPFTVTVGSPRLIGVGSYVRFGSSGNTYRVEDKNGSVLTVRPVGAVVAQSIASGSAVNLVQYGVREPVTSGSLSTTLRLTDTSGFAVHDRIFVRDTLGTANSGTENAGNYVGIVTARNIRTGELTVTWQGGTPSASNPVQEGAAVRRDVNAVTSGSTADTSGGGTMVGGVSRNDTARVPAGDALFEQTFGMTEAQLLQQTGVPIQTSYPGGVLAGINYVRANVNIGGNTRLCGTGILIVDGNLTFNGTCDEGFVGIIYVKGQFDQQGNGFIKGAVIAQGGSGSKVAGNAQTNTVNPTGSKIVYDPESVLRYGSLLSRWQTTPIAGTWREQ